MYLKYPWGISTSSGTVSRDVPENFLDLSNGLENVLTPRELRQCARVSSLNNDILVPSIDLIKKSIESLDESSLVAGNGLLQRLESVPETELSYTGYIVDWMIPDEIYDHAMEISGPVIEPIDSPMHVDEEVIGAESVFESITVVDRGDDFNEFSVIQLKDMLKAKGLPLTGRKADLIERLVADRRANVVQVEAIDVSPRSDKAPMTVYSCRVELPKALMNWSEFTKNLTGPNNAHFAHITQQCPSVAVTCAGAPSAALVGDARLHVKLVGKTKADFSKAKSLVEDLVRAVVEVGIDLSLSEESQSFKDSVIKDVRVVDIV
jgi:hypothetical protein